MTWREQLRRVTVTIQGRRIDLAGASFRGVPFFVETVELSTGRRVVVHEFPLRDDPFVEDLGRRARKFRVEGYVLGDDYLTQKDALLSALESGGPGQLLLPYYDVKRAIGETSSVRESRAEGGYAVFAIEFCETPVQAPAPTVAVDAVSQVAVKATAAHAASRAELGEKLQTGGLPGFAVASAATALTKASDALSAKLSPLVTDAQELASLNGQLTLLTAQASTLVTQPFALADQFLAAITGLSATAQAAPGAVVDALVDAYHEDLGALVVATTSTRARELTNQLAITSALRRTMAVEAARIAPAVPYVSIDDAILARDRVAALLEEQAGLAGDTAYPALVDLRSEVLRSVPGAQVFARVVEVTRRVALPSLLLAYQLYGSVDKEPDIIARNRVSHPGFIVGTLKVLSA